MNTKPVPDFILNPRMPSGWSERSDVEAHNETERNLVKALTGRKPPKPRARKTAPCKARKAIERAPKGEQQLERWARLGWLSDDPAKNRALLAAGIRLRDARRRGEDINAMIFACGSTWPALSGLALDGLDKLAIGQRYETDARAAKATGFHMARAGLEILAKWHGLLVQKDVQYS